MLNSNWMDGFCINRKRYTKIWIRYGMKRLLYPSKIHSRPYKSKCSIMIGDYRMISWDQHYLISQHSSCHESLNSWFRSKIQRNLAAQMQRVKVSFKIIKRKKKKFTDFNKIKLELKWYNSSSGSVDQVECNTLATHTRR